jgi:4-diphosphocytidyl-2-C-methyl-D-erythritol kinase
MLTLPAPAKLNLFLHVTGRRADGMHALQTIFQLIDLCDQLRFRLRDDGEIQVHTPALADLAMTNSTVYRAAMALPRAAHQGINIQVDKVIPAGAGLGGGSSDAATTLLALNHLWQLQLDTAELLKIGAQIGADVPVFIGGRSAWAEGIGEQLTPLDLPSHIFLVIFPGCHVATAEIFSAQQLTRHTPAITLADFHAGRSHNDCTAVTRQLYPEVDAALQWLSTFGEARMSGTGSSCFVAFESKQQAHQAQQQVPAHWQSFIVTGMNQSPLLNLSNKLEI